MAIAERKPVEFDYSVPGAAPGKRIGHPHAVFSTSQGHIHVDIYKISGACTDPSDALPIWKEYRIEFISNMVLLEHEPFEIAPSFNMEANKYEKIIDAVGLKK